MYYNKFYIKYNGEKYIDISLMKCEQNRLDYHWQVIRFPAMSPPSLGGPAPPLPPQRYAIQWGICCLT